MDGINGITILYALTAISFALLPLHQDSLPLLIQQIVLCSFGVFNVKKSKTFAGDVGSISLAVFFRLLL
jgi:UDP-N-acetylmuramyl pentapeptide phosphotransferase/UDP-N-acetylglucosamine-1-phosphate transferase